MPTPITVFTGDGAEVANVSNAGTTDYWVSLRDVVRLVHKAIDQASLTSSAVYVSPPESTRGTTIPSGGSISIAIPPHLVAQFGKGCIPLLMYSYEDGTDGHQDIWKCVESYDYLDVPNANNSIGLRMDDGGSAVDPNTVEIINNFGRHIMVRGYLWFPARNNASAAYRLT